MSSILVCSGDISIALTDPKNQDVPFTIDDNQNGTFTIGYTAKLPGVHCISVLFGDNEIPISPIKVNVEPSVDVSKIRVEGLETSKCLLSLSLSVDIALEEDSMIKYCFLFICSLFVCASIPQSELILFPFSFLLHALYLSRPS